MRSSSDNWQRNLETVVQWSPYETEEDLLQQVIQKFTFYKIPQFWFINNLLACFFSSSIS